MHTLLKAVTIVDPDSPHHQQVRDLLIANQQIARIAPSIEPEVADEIQHWEGHCAAPGFVDLRAHTGDPGLEHLEDLETGTRAAAAGGFTQLGILPTTDPPISSKAQVAYLQGKGRTLPTEIIPLATLSKPDKPGELTEMLDLLNAGVRGFSQGDAPITDVGLLKRAMQYSQPLNTMLMLHPQHPGLHEQGDMNEGRINIQLGLSGNPPLAEHIAINRDLELCQYTGAHIHISKVTTARSVALIARAKASGLPVSCDTGLLYLTHTEQDLLDYTTQLKLSPPLRTAADQEALRKGLIDGTIDALTADHQPVKDEDKACEFPMAVPGAIGLQTALPLLLQAFDWPEVLQAGLPAFTLRPRHLLGLPPVSVREGAPADLTLFDPSAIWHFNASTNYSRSSNSVHYGTSLRGLVYATFLKGAYIPTPQMALGKA